MADFGLVGTSKEIAALLLGERSRTGQPTFVHLSNKRTLATAANLIVWHSY